MTKKTIMTGIVLRASSIQMTIVIEIVMENGVASEIKKEFSIQGVRAACQSHWKDRA